CCSLQAGHLIFRSDRRRLACPPLPDFDVSDFDVNSAYRSAARISFSAKQTTAAASSLQSGRTVVHSTAIASKSRERASAEVVPRTTNLHGAQRAGNVLADRGYERLHAVIRNIRLSICEPYQRAGQG